MTTCSGKSCSFGQLSFVCSVFPFAFEGGMLDLNELDPEHCLSIYFETPVTENLAIDINSKIGSKKATL